ncbi:MAG: hypothetical protein A4E53_01841 [Pelotomaculum sp. PtaB.Bin104]|nr:MAG: hypothetical protein A4E53_01841 [Pelotomaculum sp. PtaB.Bin104]OPY63120.1 MAG: hypothetical protein A4E56_00835 [Pelotomaculum sp. PtaU1.Bin065]
MLVKDIMVWCLPLVGLEPHSKILFIIHCVIVIHVSDRFFRKVVS